MQKKTWSEAIRLAADPPRVEHYLAALRETEAAPLLKKAKAEGARVLAALLSGSQALSELLLAHPDWTRGVLDVEALRHPRQPQGLERDLNATVGPGVARGDYADALDRVREFKQRETLRIATRDLARLGSVIEITWELSNLADLCIATVSDICQRQLTERLGQPWHLDPAERWQPTRFCVLGLGKLGGQELNYSSDVDVLFLYTEEGFVFRDPPRETDTGKGLSSHQFYRRLAESLVSEIGRLTPQGTLYRIDLRLRPEGKAGPLARSLSSYENYYWQWGQTWERLMLIKARRVAGDPALASDFLEAVQPFSYPRSLSEQALADIAGMKRRIETEVVRTGELDRNIKLGRGGIREIEFIAQILQVLNAGHHPFLAQRQTIPTLEKLAEYRLLQEPQARLLIDAYQFLREVEHRLQMENNLQTHTIPTERQPRERLARLMGFADLPSFETALNTHRRHVRTHYEGLLGEAPEPTTPGLPDFEEHAAAWPPLLANHSFRDPGQALRLVQAFIHGPGFGHISRRTEDYARRLLARFLALCPRRDQPVTDHAQRFPDGDPASRRLSDPDRVLARLDTFIGAYGARALLFETWASNPSLFELLVLLFDRSEFLAETAIRTPDLVDELELSGYLRRSKTAEQTLKDLRLGQHDTDQRLWLRRYHQTELMRIGLRDILGLADFEQNLEELSALADACLQYALEIALRQSRFKSPPLAIIGLGKLGGAELNYGSDLDILFVTDDKPKPPADLHRLAVDVMDLLSTPTEFGVAFQTDARLRPDGEKGLLVTTLRAAEEYYRLRARLWEIQAISRARPIAGHPELGLRFQQLATQLADFRLPDQAAAAAKDPGWKQEIARMRLRIEKERTPKGKEPLAIKTGAGGLVDAEFIAQTLCLEHGWHEPNTLGALRRAREHGAMPAQDADLLIDNYRKLRRIEAILRRWSYEGETELPDDPAPLYRVAVRCGFTNADDFMAAVRRYRQNIRAVYVRQTGGLTCPG